MAMWKWALILIGVAIPIIGEYWLLPYLHLGAPVDAAWFQHWREVGPH